MEKNYFIGVDYGSKLAGTTVIAWLEQKQLRATQSAKKQDADAWLANWVHENQPRAVYLDAPLSLPGVYRAWEGFDDYFYRAADRTLGAMSPLFIGGLTARAMRLQNQLAAFPFYEVYPGYLAKITGLKAYQYKKKQADVPAFLIQLQHRLPFPIATDVAWSNWHQVDALLAWWSGWRHQTGQAELHGKVKEGQIII